MAHNDPHLLVSTSEESSTDQIEQSNVCLGEFLSKADVLAGLPKKGKSTERSLQERYQKLHEDFEGLATLREGGTLSSSLFSIAE